MRSILVLIGALLCIVGCSPNADSSELPITLTAPEIIHESTEASVTPTLTSTPTQISTKAPIPSPTGAPIIEMNTIDIRLSEVDQMILVYIPEGTFEMGSADGWDSEQPVHTVNLSAFWMDQTEVTNHQYSICMESGACREPANLQSFSRIDYFINPIFSDYPVVNVSWSDAVDYCQWAGRRLPTEAEWEKAAKNGKHAKYPWGEGIDCSFANYINCTGDTSEVGNYPKGVSPFGVLDLAGNVWEWIADWYDDLYYETHPLDYPSGPESGAYRVVRGGSWNDYEWYLRTTSRYSYFPDTRRVSVGFRCVMDDVEQIPEIKE